MVKEETKKGFAEGLETLVGDFGFALGVFIGGGSIKTGSNFRKYFETKVEKIYTAYQIPFTPRRLYKNEG